MKLKFVLRLSRLFLNKIIIHSLFLSFLFSQINTETELEVRYGNSENDFNYSEVFVDSRFLFQNTDYMINGLLSFEQSYPPEIGLNENGLRKVLIGYYKDDLSVELGDVYQTWGRGLILNQVDYQNLDFDTGSRGFNLLLDKSEYSINILYGDVSVSQSTTVLGNYNPRKPNYFTNQSIYGFDYNKSFMTDNFGISFLAVENENNIDNHFLSNIRLEKFYNKGELYLSFAHKESHVNSQDFEQGNGFYFSNINSTDNWTFVTNYRRYRFNIQNPLNKGNIVNNHARALDIQQSPTGYYQHNFKLLSRNSKQVNLNDEVGIELEFARSFQNLNTLIINYIKSSSTTGWHLDENGAWQRESLTKTFNNNNSLFPSNDKDSYPYDEIFIEFNGYNENQRIFYTVGFDFLYDTFAVLSNSDSNESFEVKKVITIPLLVNIYLNNKWNIEMQIEMQRAKKGFEIKNNNESSFSSLFESKYQYNNFLSFSANYKQKWTFSFAHEVTNADESLISENHNINDLSNSWNSISIAHRFGSDDSLQIFYGSVRGGLDCTNGVCRYIQSFDDGLRIDYTSNFN